MAQKKLKIKKQKLKTHPFLPGINPVICGKFFLFLFSFCFCNAFTAAAQEIRANVTVVAQQITGVDKKVFTTLQNSIK
jgi:hypothetical protein